MNDINPREFGKLEAEVHSLRAQMTMLQSDVRALLELANKGRGGLWFGMTMVSGASAAIVWVINLFRG